MNKDIIIVNGMRYDAAKFKKYHPGGSLFIEVFAGTDATEAFYTYHRKAFNHSKLTTFRHKEQTHKAPTNKAQTTDKLYKDFFELAQIINSVVPNQGFAPTAYYVKVFGILFIAVSLELYMLYFGKDYMLSILLGLFFAFIGLNIQHDGNHGAVSSNPTINFWMGLTQNYIGGDYMSWIEQHDVQHHIVTNHYTKDPDISGEPLFRFHERDRRNPSHRYQHIYLWILELLYGIYVVFAVDKLQTHFSNICMKLFFMSRLVLPLMLHSDELTKQIVCTLLTFMTGGFYLSFFFIISHNFENVRHFDDADLKNVSLLQRQVESSSNVGGSVLGFMNGGLNYQIEHHLFPRISHWYYPQIAPIVAGFCKQKGIKYVHFNSIGDNFVSTVRYLYNLGHH
eukprot:CAMPEP_0197052058 /NCGR_PEP_ID=MMETSP1384-20130603/26593_1 /TAXON_ID=29189 /ORGANISM="Ammonia sp." /LENGTH=394 /DNA_ID=CAMNT_0042484703 /DNA_START=75 /DNA_END=1259 /DNA_ORIENTATION=+